MNGDSTAWTPAESVSLRDGKQFAVGFSLWDLDSGKMLRGLPKVEEGGEFGFVKHRTITFVPDGSFIVGHDRQSILIWDTNTNETEYAFQVKHFTQERPTMMEENTEHCLLSRWEMDRRGG